MGIYFYSRMKVAGLYLWALVFLPSCSLLPPVSQAEEMPTVGVCWQNTATEFGLSEASMSPVLEQNIEKYKLLVEESLMHRETAIAVMGRLEAEGKASGEVPLSGYDLDRLNAGLMDHLSLRDDLYQVAYAQSCWHKPAAKIYQRLSLQPLTPMNQLKGTMLSLSAALILYDNYLMMSSLYEENSKLRRFLNTSDPAYAKGQGELKRIAFSYGSNEKRRIVKRTISFYERQLKKMPKALSRDENFIYLNTLITQSHAYNMMKEDSVLGQIGKQLAFMTTITEDDMINLGNEGVNLFSALFGNAMGLFESRKGKLYHNDKVLKKVNGQLQAGDILLEKTPFRLTDKMIPGHWGHVAIWIGNEEELKALDIWEHPVVKPYQDKIRAGASVVEALRSGVQMNSMRHFLNVDDLALLRRPDSDKADKVRHILLALKQVGKSYDFNFDVETTDKIVCSELVYTVYTDMRWPTEKALGRYTISPDNVAKKAVDDGSLKLISFYHDGKEVKAQKLELMARLMGETIVSSLSNAGNRRLVR